METTKQPKAITITANVNAPIEKIWDCWTVPAHITGWTFANDDWHAPHAENDLKTGGRFKTHMAAKDGSFAFDFEGTYTKVEHHQQIDYTLDDDRKVWISFETNGGSTKITQKFEMEDSHPEELQRGGWQAILNNFKKYCEQN